MKETALGVLSVPERIIQKYVSKQSAKVDWLQMV